MSKLMYESGLETEKSIVAISDEIIEKKSYKTVMISRKIDDVVNY
jgi:hypothetical protein